MAGDQRSGVAGAHTTKVWGAVAMESGADVGLAGGGGVALVAQAALGLAVGGGHVTTGAKVELRPGGGPAVSAPEVPAAASAFARPADAVKGRLTHTGAPPRVRPNAAAPARVAREERALPPKPAAVAGPCGGRGTLARGKQAERFANAMWPLRDRWKELNPEGRRALIEGAVTRNLVASGMPPYGVLSYPFGGGAPRVGEFSAPDWQLRISSKLLESPDLTTAQAEELEKTAYHEARHAEQWYLVARREAATTTSRRALLERVAVSDEAARAAMADPIRPPGGAPPAGNASRGTTRGGAADTGLVACADAMHAAYIENAAGRDAAIAEVDAASRDRSRGGDARWKAALARYRALPEEADAFAAEDFYHATAYAF